jgi:hypothetical protein
LALGLSGREFYQLQVLSHSSTHTQELTLVAILLVYKITKLQHVYMLTKRLQGLVIADGAKQKAAEKVTANFSSAYFIPMRHHGTKGNQGSSKGTAQKLAEINRKPHGRPTV